MGGWKKKIEGRKEYEEGGGEGKLPRAFKQSHLTLSRLLVLHEPGKQHVSAAIVTRRPKKKEKISNSKKRKKNTKQPLHLY